LTNVFTPFSGRPPIMAAPDPVQHHVLPAAGGVDVPKHAQGRPEARPEARQLGEQVSAARMADAGRRAVEVEAWQPVGDEDKVRVGAGGERGEEVGPVRRGRGGRFGRGRLGYYTPSQTLVCNPPTYTIPFSADSTSALSAPAGVVIAGGS
jgi:hypothetical protein